MSDNKSGVLVGAIAIPALIFGTVFGVLLIGGTEAEATCLPTAGAPIAIDPGAVPETTIAGYGHEQLVNAAYIIEAGKALGLGVRDQTIGVMTAMGESSLIVVNHGDVLGPDSRGLFQQRALGWGSYEERMDPHMSATNFFKAMMKIEGRDDLEPTIIAHRTQRNADPWHYEEYWPTAVEVVEALAGVDTGLADCGTTIPGEVSSTGWATPAAGPVSSRYGMRMHPIDKVWRLHSGVDLNGGGCEGPIWAAQDGTVTFTGFDSVGNGTITVDHGGGVQTSYLHQYASGILVSEGEQVSAGQQIGRVGSSGKSSGCHLHFMVVIDGSPTDPEPFMAAVGIQLGQ